MKEWLLSAATACFGLFVAATLQQVCCAEDVDDPTGRVFPALADFVLNRDAIKKRYAFQILGETTYQDPDVAPKIGLFCHMEAEDRKSDFHYHAYGKPLSNLSPTSFQGEDWLQKLQVGTQLGIRMGTIKPNSIYRVKPKGVRPKAFLNSEGYFQIHFEPLEDILLIATFFSHSEPNTNSVEKIFLKGAKLLSVTEGAMGTVESKWHWVWGSLDLDITLTQSRPDGDMPIRVQYSDRQTKNADFFSDTHIEWKKQNDLWVPVRINAASVVNCCVPVRPPTQVQIAAKIDWLIGDEVEPAMLQADLPDHRVPFMEKFGTRFDMVVEGQTFRGDPWVRPEGLYMVEDGKLKPSAKQ